MRKPDVVKIILIVALIAAVAVAGYFAYQYSAANQEIDRIIQEQEEAAEAARIAQEEAEAAQKEQEQLVSDYIADMQLIAINTTLGADVCMQEAQTLVSSESDYAANVTRTGHSTVVSTLLTYRSDIDDILLKWSTPPEGYEEDFENVSAACDDFDYLCTQIINPLNTPELFAALFMDAADTFNTSYTQYLQPYVTSWQADADAAIAAAKAEMGDTP